MKNNQGCYCLQEFSGLNKDIKVPKNLECRPMAWTSKFKRQEKMSKSFSILSQPSNDKKG